MRWTERVCVCVCVCEQEMREGKGGRMNLNLRTAVVSLNRCADGALSASLVRCLTAPAALIEQLNQRTHTHLHAHTPFTISSNSTEDDLTRSGNNLRGGTIPILLLYNVLCVPIPLLYSMRQFFYSWHCAPVQIVVWQYIIGCGRLNLLSINLSICLSMIMMLCCSNLHNRNTGAVVMLLAFLIGPPTHSIKADRLSFSCLKTGILNFIKAWDQYLVKWIVVYFSSTPSLSVWFFCILSIDVRQPWNVSLVLRWS